VDALNGVDKEEGIVAESGNGGDLVAKVDVVEGVDEVHHIAEEDGGALHRDSAALLLIQVVHEPNATIELQVDDVAARGNASSFINEI